MNSDYFSFVAAHAALLARVDLPLFDSLKTAPVASREPVANAPVALLFSPHPDDECITGALALRLMEESGWRVINVPVTLGSNPRRQEERLAELQRACRVLGVDLHEIEPGGLAHVSNHTRQKEVEQWQIKVEMVAAVLSQFKPRLVVCPNDDDGHATHIGTHHLVLDALALANHACWLAQTEFWRAMPHPNLLLESTVEQATRLVSALACHVGEVKRNPYHLRLPSWLSDNVRRGAELVGGAGVAAPDFAFGSLYRLDRFDGEALVSHKERHIVPAAVKITDLLV
jgi:LmbE family N-acetylglucosaminyl deacetylase